MNITGSTRLYMIVGADVEHSLSPKMHNAAFIKLGLDSKYVYVGANIQVHEIADFITALRVLDIKGVSCTTPLKAAIIPYLDDLDPIAARIGAVNTVVNRSGKLHGYNTDWIGIVKPLKSYLGDIQKKYLLIGAGGAAAAAAYGLSTLHADVTIANRTLAQAESVADQYGFHACLLNKIPDLAPYDIIINTLPVHVRDHMIFEPIENALNAHHTAFDITYGSDNSFTSAAGVRGATVIDGREMLLYQGLEQFKLFTGKPAPELVMRQAIGL